MTRQDRQNYILNLHNVTKTCRKNSNLFCEGCCFSAGQTFSSYEEYFEYLKKMICPSYEEYIEYLKMKGFAIDCMEYLKTK